MFARILGVVGRTLIAIGTLMLLFVAYQLWGTNLQEASSQRHLDKEFGRLLATRPRAQTTTSSSTTSTTSTTSSTTTAVARPTISRSVTVPPKVAPADLPLPQVGEPIAEIRIPKIGVRKTVVEAVTLDQLKRAPGHYPETVLPGQKGNSGIAGHRTTYGAPFHNIDKLENGDEIVVTTLQGAFHYRIDSKLIVGPSDVSVLADKGDNRLTLTACHPKYSARQRIVVSGVLVGRPVARLKGQDRAARAGRTRLPGRTDRTAPVGAGGLDGTRPSTVPAFLWGALCGLIWLMVWGLSRLMRRRTGRRLVALTPYLIGVPLFLAVLYVFFENFARLLPSNF